MSDLRGRTTRERRLAEKVAREWAERRTAQAAADTAVDLDLDRASAEAEVEVAREREAAGPSGVESPAASRPARRRPRTAPTANVGGVVAGDRSARRLPDLSSLPPLLAATGAFETLRERLGPSDRAPGPRGRHAGV